jgi:hypothetical protein
MGDRRMRSGGRPLRLERRWPTNDLGLADALQQKAGKDDAAGDVLARSMIGAWLTADSRPQIAGSWRLLSDMV